MASLDLFSNIDTIDNPKVINQNNNKKNLGQIFTPIHIVNNILDLSGYSGVTILDKYIMENSCGDGAFLVEIVKRYIKAFCSLHNNKDLLKKNLSKYIYGIEKDKEAYEECLKNLNSIIKGVNWNIVNGDSLLEYKSYMGKMDFVVGNPPYIRVHNTGDSYSDLKDFNFTQQGMTDVYLAFYEIGLKMLNKNGQLCYITPSSFFKSLAGKNFRDYIINNNILSAIVDLEHYQPFKATTYTCITLLKNNHNSIYFDYYKYDINHQKVIFIDSINTNDCYISSKIFLASNNNLEIIKKIQEYNSTNAIEVKNGYATLADNIFIKEYNFDDDYIIPIIKASNGKKYYCFYPYDKDGNPISLSLLKNHKIFTLLKSKEQELRARSIKNKDNTWYLFGRSQGINDTYKNKIAINNVIKDLKSIKLNYAPSGYGVYSGLYILSEYTIDEIAKIIKTKEFLDYIYSLQNYKNGGYYTFSSKDLEKFLNFKLRDKSKYEQYEFFRNTN